MGVLVTFRGLAKDGSSHEYNKKYMSIDKVWFINRMFLLEEARKAGYKYSACKDLEEERTYKVYKVMNEEYRYNDDNVEEKYGSGEITKEEYDTYVPRERMTIGRIRNTRRGIQGGIRRQRQNIGEYVEDFI